MPLPPLSQQEIERYGRHLTLPEVGTSGQRKLKEASVLCVGAGGLGSPLAMYLAAAGIGRLGLVDFDAVELSNLQRQVLHGTGDVGRPKLDSARATIGDINPCVHVETFETRLVAGNAMEILAPYDVVADGTDNFAARYLVSDACVLLGKPNVYGSVFRFEGQASVFHAPKGPCYRCLHPEPPPPGMMPNCAEGGVLGVLPGLIGLIQATEAIKLILGVGEPLVGRLLTYDALSMRFKELKLNKDPQCPICGTHPSITELSEAADLCPAQAATPEITVEQLKARMTAAEDLCLLDVREPAETGICRLEGGLLIPLRELERRLDELNKDQETVVYCRIGQRSAVAVEILRSCGFSKAVNLAGGLHAWADRIDPSMPRY